MRRFFQITVSSVAVMIILLGTRYAYSHESFHNVNLQERYQQINRESFDKTATCLGQLGRLIRQDADGITSFADDDHPVSIELDRQRITSERTYALYSS